MTEAESIPHVLTIDAGTSALKAVLYNSEGRALSVTNRRYGYRFGYHIPQPGWAEADPNDWWDALVGTLADLRSQGFDLQAVQALGVTGQMHTPVLLDGNGAPLPPTILWLDRRATSETEYLQTALGLPHHQLNSTFTLPKLLWLKQHRPEVLARTKTLLWPKDYLRFRLTGEFYTDVTEAAGAALLDWEHRTWAQERLTLVDLDPAVLPSLRPAGADAGPLRAEIAKLLGLTPTVRIIVGAGDVLALQGAAPPCESRLCCSIGSSSMISMPLSPEQQVDDPDQRLYVYPFLSQPLLNGVLSTSGASLTWARRALYGEAIALETVLDAALVTPPGGDGLFFLPFLAGERSPYWNDELRGGFYGLTLAHERPHLLRAVLEGVAYSLRYILDIADELGAPVHEIALAGGGATVSGWPQIFANICQRPVLIYCGEDTVTRPLFAYCTTALDRTLSFETALTNTFVDPPTRYEARPALYPIYESIYRRYRRLADFADEMEG